MSQVDVNTRQLAATQAGPDERDTLRRAAERFHGKLADTLPVVHQLAVTDSQFWQVARALTAAMVNLELTIAVLGDHTTLPITTFDGQVVEPRPANGRPRDDGRRDDERHDWMRIWALRRSAASFCGRLNRCRSIAVPLGLTPIQSRVLTAAVLAVGHSIDTISGLRVPDEYYELVR